jgi:hypothetical protein
MYMGVGISQNKHAKQATEIVWETTTEATAVGYVEARMFVYADADYTDT